MPIPSSISRPAEVAFWKLADFGHTHPHLFVALTVAGAALPPTLLSLIRSASRSYRGYLDVGRGGIPHNIFGWMVQGLGQLIAIRDPLSTLPFERPSPAVFSRYGDSGKKSYIRADLPRRESSGGGRPVVPAYVAPHRQISQQAKTGTREAQNKFLQSLATENADVLEIRPSQLEGNDTPALFAKQGPKLGTPFWGSSSPSRGPVEIIHTHAEGSAHMIFSLEDARQVVQAGWGERHLLAGSRGAAIPVTYLIVYAPRDDVELQVWKTLALASARFCAGIDLKEADKLE